MSIEREEFEIMNPDDLRHQARLRDAASFMADLSVVININSLDKKGDATTELPTDQDTPTDEDEYIIIPPATQKAPRGDQKSAPMPKKDAPMVTTSRKTNSGRVDTTRIYLEEIGRTPLLNAGEEIVLSKIIEKGSHLCKEILAGRQEHSLSKSEQQILKEAEFAKDRFIKANLRLVVSIARRYPLPQGWDLLDVVQEGNLGLEHAVDKFDWRRGFKFSTYSTYWIRQAIGRALDQKASLIRIPGDRSSRLRSALRQVSGEGDQLGIEDSEMYKLTTPVSINKKVGSDGDTEYGDLLVSDLDYGNPEAALTVVADHEQLEKLLKTLEFRSRYAVEARFGFVDGERKSFREVGQALDITAEAARRLVFRALGRLRDEAIEHFKD